MGKIVAEQDSPPKNNFHRNALNFLKIRCRIKLLFNSGVLNVANYAIFDVRFAFPASLSYNP